MLLKDATFLVMDLETTGFNAKEDLVTEVGAVWMDPQGAIQRTYQSFCNIGDRKIGADVSAVTNILAEDCDGAPTFQSCLREIEQTPYHCLAGHNIIAFDNQWIKPPSTLAVLDTMRLAQKLYPEAPNYKNTTMRYYLGIMLSKAERFGGAHRAEWDAKVTALCLHRMLQDAMDRSKEPDAIELNAFIKWVDSPNDLSNRKMGFGKHFSKTWAQVAREEPSYLEWMMGPKCTMEKTADQVFTINKLRGRG